MLFREPLSRSDARRLIRQILKNGSVRYTKHALEEMEDDDLHEPDIVNALRCGLIHNEAELERGHPDAVESWRYRTETDRIGVVVAFRSEDALVVATAWRKRKRGTP